MIYLDYNATTPVHPRVIEAMLPFFQSEFGNASAQHLYGWKADEAVEQARNQIAQALHCPEQHILFNSGATEGLNFLLQGLCSGPNAHILVSPSEHSAVLECARFLSTVGVDVEYLKLDQNGNIQIDLLQQQLREHTVLVIAMLANNETGLIQDITTISNIVHQHSSALLLSDITQAVGKIPVSLQTLGIDLAVCSAHKCYGPKGVGAVILPSQVQTQILPSIYGGGHEKGLRAGTLNIPGIVGMGTAVELSQKDLQLKANQITEYRNQIESALETIPDVILHCHSNKRLPNTINASILNCDINILIRIMKDLAISRGSACHSNIESPSHVLTAMGVPEEIALQSIRISLGNPTTQEEVERSIQILTSSIEKARNLAS